MARMADTETESTAESSLGSEDEEALDPRVQVSTLSFHRPYFHTV